MEKSSQICEYCNYGILNYEEINKARDLDLLVLTAFPNPVFDKTIKCSVCLNIFSEGFMTELVNKIKAQIGTGEYKDFRLSTSFSSIFQLAHILLKFETVILIENFDSGILRKIFKPIFGKVVKDSLDISFVSNSNSELSITFDFDKTIYEETFKAFDFISRIKNILDRHQIEKFSNAKSFDKSHVNDIMNSCNKQLYMSLMHKYNLMEKYTGSLFVNAEIVNNSIYLKGSYMKLSREIGQSPWEINGVKVCFSSVQDELKRKLVPLFDCSDIIMHAGGREDRDVRMLGTGRPIVIEVINPHNLSVVRSIGDELLNIVPHNRL